MLLEMRMCVTYEFNSMDETAAGMRNRLQPIS